MKVALIHIDFTEERIDGEFVTGTNPLAQARQIRDHQKTTLRSSPQDTLNGHRWVIVADPEASTVYHAALLKKKEA